jgi:hypothetical protein
MKRNILSILIIWVIIVIAILNIFPVKASPTDVPTIFIFNQTTVLVSFQNVPVEYEGSDGLIWLQRVADPWQQEIELTWVTKNGTVGLWKGTIPPVPISGYYYLKNGLIFYNGFGNPALIPESEYKSLDHYGINLPFLSR